MAGDPDFGLLESVASGLFLQSRCLVRIHSRFVDVQHPLVTQQPGDVPQRVFRERARAVPDLSYCANTPTI
jgi:hypothetical protein